MKGHIDQVTPEGLIEGWCWNDRSASERVTVSIRVDGVEVGRTVAGQYREDLHQAGVGDGRHFFRFMLPDAVLGRNRAQSVTLADAATSEPVGEAYTLRTERAIALDNRLSELEARSRLLESSVAELAQARARDGGQAELFAVVGAFFERLSRDLARGVAPSSEQQLSEVLRAMSRAHPPLAFPTAEAPAASVLIEAACPINQLHACLSAIWRAVLEVGVRVTVLDIGAFDEVALLPSLVRGIRYVRTAADLVSEWIEASHGDDSPVMLFLGGQAVLDAPFLAEITEWFASRPDAGAVGGCVINPNGTLRHAGLRLVGERLEDLAGAEPAKPVTETCPAHALSHKAAAFRRAAVQDVGGLDPAFGDDLGAAVIDLCFRLREAGWSVAFHSRATLSLPPGSSEPWVAPAASDQSQAGGCCGSAGYLAPPARTRPSRCFLEGGRLLPLERPRSSMPPRRAAPTCGRSSRNGLGRGPGTVSCRAAGG